MLTRKSRMASLVAIAATVMLVFSTNAANAAHQSGYKPCRPSHVGNLEAFVHGTGYLQAPGDSVGNRRYFDARSGSVWLNKNAVRNGGGSWSAYASWTLFAPEAVCLRGPV